MYRIIEYLDRDGINLFRVWLEGLHVEVRARIQARLFRISQGNLGDYKSVGHGVFELRFLFGSGYRIYFSLEGRNIVILLIGGDKRTQRRDIIKARQSLLEHKRR